MRLAAYCRVSTDKEDQLNSLAAQKSFFAEYTQRTGDTLVHLYADEGISGTKIKNRRAFLQMMADAERGCFDRVVVKDISRFARNTVDLLQNIRRLKALGVETQFLTANMTNMGDSEFILTIFGALAQEESANTSKRIKFGKKLNGEKGRVPNLVYGYDKMAGDYFHLTVNEGEAAVVRQIFCWYTEEGLGAAKIAARLNDRGQRTKRGCRWNQTAVCRILTNALYTGKIINGKEEVADFLTGKRARRDISDWMVTEQPTLQIVPLPLFQKAQDIMARRSEHFKAGKGRQSGKHLLSTLIRCGACGRSFRRTVRTYRNTYIRWVCSSRYGQGKENCANGVAVDEDKLISALQSYFTTALQALPQAADRFLSVMGKLCAAQDNDAVHSKALTSQLLKLRRTRQKYIDLYADELLSRTELKEKIGGLDDEIEGLARELDLHTRRLPQGKTAEQVLAQAFPTVEAIVDLRRMTNCQLGQIVEQITVDQDGSVDIFLRKLEGKTVPHCHSGT